MYVIENGLLDFNFWMNNKVEFKKFFLFMYDF